jgi:hypothetical protein
MKKRNIYISAILFIVFVVAISFFKKDEKKSIIKLNAIVTYDDKKIIITNKDTVDFVRADLSIDEYYKMRNYNLKAGESYTIWQVEFLHHNGTHYPQKRKPVQFSIWCDLNNETNGYYSKK